MLLLLLLLSGNECVQAQDPCSICPLDQIVTNGAYVLPENMAGALPTALSCDETQKLALSGGFTPGQCALLRAIGVSSIW